MDFLKLKAVLHEEFEDITGCVISINGAPDLALTMEDIAKHVAMGIDGSMGEIANLIDGYTGPLSLDVLGALAKAGLETPEAVALIKDTAERLIRETTTYKVISGFGLDVHMDKNAMRSWKRIPVMVVRVGIGSASYQQAIEEKRIPGIHDFVLNEQQLNWLNNLELVITEFMEGK